MQHNILMEHIIQESAESSGNIENINFHIIIIIIIIIIVNYYYYYYYHYHLSSSSSSSSSCIIHKAKKCLRSRKST